jgi:hypothetical protein
MATLAKLLQVEMSLPEMARKLAAAGRGKDSILAHINPKEAALLKSRGGRGEPNPETGIIEFADDEELPATSYPVSEPTEPVARDLPPEPVALPEPSFSGQDYANMFKQTERTYPSATRATAPAQTSAPAATPSFAQVPASPGYGLGDFGDATAREAEATPAPSSVQQLLARGGSALAKGGSDLAKQLGPLGFLKVGGGLAAALAGRKAAGQVSQQAAANEAEIRRLADPYRQQGQQLLNLGQAGQLTAPQQQALEAQRAAVQQQLAQSGVTGGTAQMQAEQAISRVAQQYAQDNIARGVALMGTADKYITDAIQAGYTGAKDAATLTKDFYSQIASMLPTTAGGPAVAPKG